MPEPRWATRRALSAVDRDARTRILAALARRFGDLDLAEDVLQDALAQALQTWPERGIPDTPEAWLMTTAKRKALDIVRRESVLAQKLARLRIEDELTPVSSSLADPADRVARDGEVSIPDDRLELFFACAHPALGLDDRIALTLRFVAGLSSAEVAHALLVPVPTMQQRIVRAKARIRTMGVPFRLPNETEFQARLAPVQRVLYLLFAEGYTRSAGSIHVRDDLTSEAIRLTTVLHALLPDSSETKALLALMLLTEARRPARTDSEERPIPLANQDRALWDHELLAAGLAHAESAAARGIGTYTIQASIAAVHSEAESFADTDWDQISVLYGLLEQHEPGPVVRMGKAIARGRARGASEGLRLLDELADEPALVRYRPFHIARAVTLEELGRSAEAMAAYRRALELPGNAAEDAFILSTIGEL
ncbi:MAG TPA: RNA polymerase sigma factor [Candidatus Agrococcus pullicola]|uniref:RNA polymerase sigma factor n=1 Tax=Candidatus Agrococcus pullicola TaxID=2838429 RepID=A0A9D2CAE4_9MICO|nr:RNA polymerase sigma factor [Candidatus Agrococcus pullicola]